MHSPLEDSRRKALEWVRKNTIPQEGVTVTSLQRRPYPEVTGYLIPTLMEAGEHDLALQYAGFLSRTQRPNGSFCGPDGKEYIFDAGQALRGLVAAGHRWDEFKPIAQKTAEYLLSSMRKDGCLPAIYDYEIPEAIEVFVLPALVEAGKLLNEPRYQTAAQKSVHFYKNLPDVLSISRLTHFLAYILDGFIDLGEAAFVRSTVEKILAQQRPDGGIPAYSNVHWVCSTGVAQLAIIAHKLDMKETRDQAIGYLVKVQNRSGGFWGSYGIFGTYFPKEEISWANKFFLDAVHLKLKGAR